MNFKRLFLRVCINSKTNCFYLFLEMIVAVSYLQLSTKNKKASRNENLYGKTNALGSFAVFRFVSNVFYSHLRKNPKIAEIGIFIVPVEARSRLLVAALLLR